LIAGRRADMKKRADMKCPRYKTAPDESGYLSLSQPHWT
jgi:hypothetical protein